MIYSETLDRFFENEETLDDFIECSDGAHTINSLKLFETQEVFLDEVMDIADVAYDEYSCRLEEGKSLDRDALGELQSFFSDWCCQHGLSWFEPKGKPWQIAELAKEPSK